MELTLTNRSRWKEIVFSDDNVVFRKKDKEVVISVDDIAGVDYKKPSILNYLLAHPFLGGGTFPGRIEIYLNRKIGGTRLYYVKIKYNEILKLPNFFKIKIGIMDYSELY